MPARKPRLPRKREGTGQGVVLERVEGSHEAGVVKRMTR